MNHLKIVGYIAVAVLAFLALFVAAPALISAKSTVAVFAGFGIILAALYAVGVLLYRGYNSLTSNKENTNA